MLSKLLKSKLHHIRVTRSDPEYAGSLLIDEEMMEMALISKWEKLLVANLDNGERFETYAIKGERGSGVCCLNGAAACKGNVGDRLIVMTFGLYDEKEVVRHEPAIVVFGPGNKPVQQ